MRVIIILLFTSTAIATEGPSVPVMSQECSSFSCRKFRGSGTVIKQDTQGTIYVLTNKHVVEKEGGDQWKQTIWVWSYRTWYPATVLALSKDHDLAILKVPMYTEMLVKKIALSSPSNGDRVTIASFKNGSMFLAQRARWFNTLPVQGGYKHDAESAYIDVTVDKGQSGGSVDDASRALVGVIYGVEEVVFNGVRYSLAIRLEHVRNFLSVTGILEHTPPKLIAPVPPKEKSPALPKEPPISVDDIKNIRNEIGDLSKNNEEQFGFISDLIKTSAKVALPETSSSVPGIIAWLGTAAGLSTAAATGIGIAIPIALWLYKRKKKKGGPSIISQLKERIKQLEDKPSTVIPIDTSSSPQVVVQHDNTYVQVESDTFREATKYAHARLLKSYPGASGTVAFIDSTVEQYISGLKLDT